MNRDLLKKNFENHRFKTSFFDNKEAAAEYLSGKIKNTSVGFGGSKTVTELNLIEILGRDNSVYSHAVSNDPDVKLKARDSECYICSANGVSETGVLINIDGSGNRVSATLYGPKKLYFIVGSNKIEPTFEKALARARNIASPLNCARLGKKTPCAVNKDRCYDCNSPERICNAIVIYERPMSGIDTEVIFIEEKLGF